MVAFTFRLKTHATAKCSKNCIKQVENNITKSDPGHGPKTFPTHTSFVSQSKKILSVEKNI